MLVYFFVSRIVTAFLSAARADWITCGDDVGHPFILFIALAHKYCADPNLSFKWEVVWINIFSSCIWEESLLKYQTTESVAKVGFTAMLSQSLL
jgi:hypothetical protein